MVYYKQGGRDMDTISKLEVDGKVISSISLNGSSPYTISPYTTTTLDNIVSTKAEASDLQEVKDITQMHDMKLYDHDRQLYEIRESVKEALAIMKHPGLIANRVLDKVDSFIAKHKRVLTDSTGTKIEMVEVSRLNEMMKQLREVVKNGNNNEGL